MRERIVTKTPLEFIWTDEEQVEASRERYLTPTDLTEMLKLHPVEFIVADLGAPLKRVPVDKCYEFWESDATSSMHCKQRSVTAVIVLPSYGYFVSKSRTRF